MVVGEVPDGFALIEQFHATLHQGFFKLFDLLKESVRHGFVGQRP